MPESTSPSPARAQAGAKTRLPRSARKNLRARKAALRRELPPEQAEQTIARLRRKLR